MGHWVTLDDDQHVYISSGGKVLATRGAISSGGGGKERGKALAARSKAAIGRASSKATRAIEHAKAAGPTLREQADANRAAKGQISTSRAEYLAKIGKADKDTGINNRASIDLRKVADEARASKGQVSTSKSEYLAKIKQRQAASKPCKRYYR